MKYSFLEPIKLGSCEIKNRMVYLAQAKWLSDDNYRVTDRQIHYYKQLAEGGTGLIITGAILVDKDWPATISNQPAIWDDSYIDGLKKLCDAVHQAGSKIFFQLWQGGRVPYECDISKVKRLHEMSKEEIVAIEDKFAQAAKRTKLAGADGIEFQICHNYISEQLLWTAENERTDEYSAEPLENGMRFSLNCIRKMRQATGENYPIAVKINGSDFKDEGYMTPEKAVAISPMLEKAGVVMISVSAGGILTGLTGMSGDGSVQEGWKVPLAARVKEAVSIPVCATGTLRHAQYMQQIMDDGYCDLIGNGRGLVADPFFVNKVAEGRENEVRYCVNCMHCLNRPRPDAGPCSVNPESTRAPEELTLEKNGNGRRVCVVGAGPAGMQAAITLAERGFKPLVLEADGSIGGQLRLAAAPDGKSKMLWQIGYYENMANKLGIEIRLNTRATADLIAELKPYAVILATGVKPIQPPIPGLDKPHVRQVNDILKNFPLLRHKNIVVVGSGATGLETATTFFDDKNNVTVIDMLPAPHVDSLEMMLALGNAKGRGIALKMGLKLLEVTDTQVIAEDVNSQEKVAIDADLVVLSLGVQSESSLYEQIKDQHEKVYNIGDSNKVAKLNQAVKAGFDCARDI